jgi:hypothetical protein
MDQDREFDQGIDRHVNPITIGGSTSIDLSTRLDSSRDAGRTRRRSMLITPIGSRKPTVSAGPIDIVRPIE